MIRKTRAVWIMANVPGEPRERGGRRWGDREGVPSRASSDEHLTHEEVTSGEMTSATRRRDRTKGGGGTGNSARRGSSRETHGLFSSRRVAATRLSRPHRPGLRTRTAAPNERTAPIPRSLRYVDSGWRRSGNNLRRTNDAAALATPLRASGREKAVSFSLFLFLPPSLSLFSPVAACGVRSRSEAPSLPKPRRVASACCLLLLLDKPLTPKK